MLFSEELIAWYHHHKRDLPWRNTQDAYLIWLSEVILQQTRVAQGLPYFHAFVDNYPNVRALANASEDEVLRLWQGLGYYSRARNMLTTAKEVVEKHQGAFPTSYAQLIQLKGVGDYTASAISSFAAGEPRAVLDGNVFRVLSRYFGIDEPINTTTGKKQFAALAQSLIDESNPSVYNQAIMEFGALQCKPKSPDCGICVLRPGCVALQQGRVDQLPVKLKTTKVRTRYFNYLVVIQNDKILMRKREKGDIWENLYDFPSIETEQLLTPQELVSSPEIQQHFEVPLHIKRTYGPVKHVLTHQKIFAQFHVLESPTKAIHKKKNWDYVLLKELNNLAKPKLIFSFLDDMMKLN